MALNLLNNNFIRFLVCLISGTNLLLFLYSNNFECAGVFILSAIVASYYSKYMVVILVAMVVCNIACTTRSQMDGFKMKKKIKKQKSKLKSKPEESEGVDDTGGTGEGTGTGTGTGTSGSGTDTTLSQNIATILSEVQRIKKELTT